MLIDIIPHMRYYNKGYLPKKGYIMASKEYFEEKSKLYYDSYLNNKSTRHVRGIIINDEGQVLLLYFLNKDILLIYQTFSLDQ